MIQNKIGTSIITSVSSASASHTNSEVVCVSKDAIWRAFAETGDVVYYLLYKAIDAGERTPSVTAADGGDSSLGEGA